MVHVLPVCNICHKNELNRCRDAFSSHDINTEMQTFKMGASKTLIPISVKL